MRSPTAMRILVTGPTGQIGYELMRSLKRVGTLFGVGRTEMDLADPDAIRRTVREVQPRVIVNAAGYTAVDRAESEPALAHAVNGVAPGVLAAEAAAIGAAIVHYSTDYVFDGTKPTPYTPDDPPCPESVYGATKLAGERGVEHGGASYLIFRTSWVYGARGHNFVRTMLRLGQERDALRVVDDQRGCPTWCRHIAEATARIVGRHAQADNGTCTFGDKAGVYHLAGAGVATWYEFAQRIFAGARVANPPALTPITTEDYPTPAVRPRNSALDCSRTRETFDVSLAPWDDALTDALTKV